MPPPSDEMMRAIEKLSNDPRNVVVSQCSILFSCQRNTCFVTTLFSLP